ncbi:MAG: dTDP-4-dehydrorhamnose reductase [Bacteroidales bacterium]|nr:dTDP-4-dehydrorhamnose reductase [Bacteroidales bacterium]
MKKKILVTGSKGQLGSELYLLQNDYQAFEFLFHDVDTLDLTDYKKVELFIEVNKPAYIVNCAAYTAVDKAETESAAAYLVNAEVPGKLAEIAAKNHCFFIHISTDYVFDGKNYKPYAEDDITNPLSVYGKSKLAGEQQVMQYQNSLIIRTSWLYSQFGHNFIKTILRLAKEREALSIVFDQAGTPTNAADLATAICKFLSFSENNPFPKGIYHFSNEGVCSWYDFAREITEQAGLACKISPITTDQYPLPAPRPHYSVLNKSKIKQTLGIEIPYWKDSFRTCLANILKTTNH